METEDLLGKLFDLSLPLDAISNGASFGFTTLYATSYAIRLEERLLAQHKPLAAILEGASDGSEEPTRRYVCWKALHVPPRRGDALLLDPNWLVAKLATTGDPLGLHYQQYGAGEAHNLIGRTLRVIGGICAPDPLQLPLQLAERLQECGAVETTGFVEKARRLVLPPANVPVRPSLKPPGAEAARLDGHSSPVTALCFTAGQAARLKWGAG